MLQRIANEIDLEIKSMRAKVSIEYSPRGIAGLPGYDPGMSKAVSDIWIVTEGSDGAGRGTQVGVPAALPALCAVQEQRLRHGRQLAYRARE